MVLHGRRRRLLGGTGRLSALRRVGAQDSREEVGGGVGSAGCILLRRRSTESPGGDRAAFLRGEGRGSFPSDNKDFTRTFKDFMRSTFSWTAAKGS